MAACRPSQRQRYHSRTEFESTETRSYPKTSQSNVVPLRFNLCVAKLFERYKERNDLA
jgi:hypothetical protein